MVENSARKGDIGIAEAARVQDQIGKIVSRVSSGQPQQSDLSDLRTLLDRRVALLTPRIFRVKPAGVSGEATRRR